MDTINNPFYCILSLLSVVPLEVILLYLLSYSLLWYSFGYFHSSLLVQFLHFSNFFCYVSFRQSIFSDLEIEIFFLVFLVFVFLFPEIPCDWGEMRLRPWFGLLYSLISWLLSDKSLPASVGYKKSKTSRSPTTSSQPGGWPSM